ncbi:unnamed protein product [Heterobilharzia americana]|nr:unnamed protein product [Heterobilharzia americana]
MMMTEKKAVEDSGVPKNKRAKIARVKNKMPAAVQITAEQLLREAKERELEVTPKAPQQKITSLSELRDFQLRKRKDYEDNIRKNRLAMQNWIKYAKFEETQGELQRARSVFERALDVDYRNIGLWLKYAEMEMRHKQVNHARNLWDRAVTLMPRANQFWYKYTYMEETVGNIAGARQIFERWMEWQPEEQAWHAYINFELRYKEMDRALQRARVIYKYALENLPKEDCQEIYKAYTLHEKKYGDRLAIEDVILNKRKFQYEEEVQANPHNYDVWFDYVRLMEKKVQWNKHERFMNVLLPMYLQLKKNDIGDDIIYLWLNYALYEELSAIDIERTRQVYRFCLKLIPHRRFTFAKIWLYAAKFEIRQKKLADARKLLGSALGICPKDKLYRGYIELEIQLREFDRCRKLYEKFLEFSPENCTTWMRYAELESLLGEIDRARGIYELAINRPLLDMPELLWKAYIDFEIEQYDWERARSLYRRLLNRTKHVKVWISLANFELCALNKLTTADLDDEDLEHLKNIQLDKETLIQEHNENEVNKAIERSRKVYQEANKALKYIDDKEQRVRLLETWKEFEYEYGDEQTQRDVDKLQPQKVVRSRRLGDERSGWEEYIEYTFPDTDAEKPNQKLLTMAARWAEQMERKKAAAAAEDNNDEKDSSEESEDDDDNDDDDDEEKNEDDQLQGDEDDNRIPEKQPTWFERKNMEEIEIDEDSD